MDDFQQSKIEPLPVIHGPLFFQAAIKKKQSLFYFQLQADLGILLKFENEAAYNKYRQQLADPFGMTSRQLSKAKMEVLYLTKVMSLSNSFRDEFTKKRG